MNVIAYEIERRPDIAYAEALDNLLLQSDVVTLHVPVTPRSTTSSTRKRSRR